MTKEKKGIARPRAASTSSQKPQVWPSLRVPTYAAFLASVGVDFAIRWQRSAEEPWYVVTSLASPEQALAYYRRRMRIDEGFRDWTGSNGWG